MVKYLNIYLVYININLVKRSIHLNKKLIKYYYYYNNIDKNLIKKSFSKNFFIKPKLRLSLFIRKNDTTKSLKFYNSQNKLQCFLYSSFSVPSRRVNLSRFVIRRASERLLLGGFSK